MAILGPEMNAPIPDQNSSYIEWKAWSQDKFAVVTAKDNAVFACELRKAEVSLNSNSLVLEIGFGNGAFAGWVRQQTSHYVGTESNLELIARAQQTGFEAHAATYHLDTIANGRLFDLIVMFDVLEHIEKSEIQEILDSASRCLSVEGRIIIRVPSGDSPFAGHLMHGDITHMTHFGSYAFYQLATLARLEVVSVHNAAFPIFGIGRVAAIRRLAIVLARKVIEAIIRSIYYANEAVVLAPTLVAVLRLRSRNPHESTKRSNSQSNG